MRKVQKQQAEKFLETLSQAHDILRNLIKRKQNQSACAILEECQQGMIQLGTMIEKSEGEGFVTISMLEEYCELTYQVYEQLQTGKLLNENKIYHTLNDLFTKIENSVKNDIKVRFEIAFLPYKVSMWDSLESVWKATDADPDCDAYVVPIPYYDKNPNGSFGALHYEGNNFPADVPVVHYEEYDLAERMPDVVYIHNPYDEANYVTSVDPRFYSDKLKKYTQCLVYIPYYITSGGMSEGQASCPAYYNADYIVIQAEKYRRFFDAGLPQSKLVPLGSPKLDRVVRLCNNPPEPPASWREKMEGKKVYFYNTSIGGMLGDTEAFLKKMEYVFHCFQGRDDACLLWRPHPLLESTFDSMRKGLRPVYNKLKKDFIENELGIYDDTPSIEETIALCDAYIGDAGTSVTSLFGISGKPLFILNNNIHSAPEEDDWHGEIIRLRSIAAIIQQDGWEITQGNKLYCLSDKDNSYHHYCDLSEYAAGNYYLRAVTVGKKIYICPFSAQDILVIADGQIEKRIELEHCIEQNGAFAGAWHIENYIFLIPWHYPAIVKYNISSKKIEYIRGFNDIFVNCVNGEWRIGGNCIWKDYLLIASPVNNTVLSIDTKSGNIQVLTSGMKDECGCISMASDGTDVWLLPYSGRTIACWNPIRGSIKEYSGWPDAFQCKNRFHNNLCEDRPFSRVAFCGEFVYFSPWWGNMFLVLDKRTGVFKEWKPPFEVKDKERNGYYRTGILSAFIFRTDSLGEWTYRLFSGTDRKLYDINLENGAYKEIPITYDRDELKKHEPGFCETSEWLQYACQENAFNSLENFLDGDITGNAFDQDRQLAAYRQNAANSDGTSGEKIYQFVRRRIKTAGRTGLWQR